MSENIDLPAIPGLHWQPALTRPDLLAAPVARALTAWADEAPEVHSKVAVAEIDPELADTAALTDAFNIPLEISANCVVVAGARAGEERIAAAVVLATTRADVNTRVRKLLDVRKASFLAMDRAVAESDMAYGGITPIGLPDQWRVLIDARVAVPGSLALIGSGVRHSKLLLPGDLLGRYPRAEVIDGLGVPIG